MIYRFEEAELQLLPVHRKMRRNSFTTFRDAVVATEPNEEGVEVHGYASFAFMNSLMDMKATLASERERDYNLVYYSDRQQERYMTLRLRVVDMLDIGRMAGRLWYEMRLLGSTIHAPQIASKESIITQAANAFVEILGYGPKGGIYV